MKRPEAPFASKSTYHASMWPPDPKLEMHGSSPPSTKISKQLSEISQLEIVEVERRIAPYGFGGIGRSKWGEHYDTRRSGDAS